MQPRGQGQADRYKADTTPGHRLGRRVARGSEGAGAGELVPTPGTRLRMLSVSAPAQPCNSVLSVISYVFSIFQVRWERLEPVEHQVPVADRSRGGVHGVEEAVGPVHARVERAQRLDVGVGLLRRDVQGQERPGPGTRRAA